MISLRKSEILTFFVGLLCFFLSLFFPFLNGKPPFLVFWHGILELKGDLEEMVVLIQLWLPYLLLMLFVAHLLLTQIKTTKVYLIIINSVFSAGTLIVLFLFLMVSYSSIDGFIIGMQFVFSLLLFGFILLFHFKKLEEKPYLFLSLTFVCFILLLHIFHPYPISDYTYFLFTSLIFFFGGYLIILILGYLLTQHIERSIILINIVLGVLFLANSFVLSFMYSISLGNNEFILIRIITSIYLIMSALFPILGWQKIRHFAISHGIYLWFRYTTTFLIMFWFFFIFGLVISDGLLKYTNEHHSINFFLTRILNDYLGNLILLFGTIFLYISFYLDMVLYRRYFTYVHADLYASR